jgi:lipoprotein-anchoring transpeptidase ErfK/SrfK
MQAIKGCFMKLLRIVISLMTLGVLFWAVGRSAQAQDPTPTNHVVQRGENLYRIGQRYGFTVDELLLANNISDPSIIYAGQIILLPVPIGGGEEFSTPGGMDFTNAATDAPADIAAYIIPPANGTTASPAPSTETIAPEAVASAPAAVEAPATAEAGTGGQTIHIVQANEGLALIASQYGVNWTDVARVNNIANPNIIYAGMQLVIPNPTQSPPYDYGQPAPSNLQNRRIVVDLSEQTIRAYENEVLLKSVIVSTGLPGTPTVQGDYSVYSKLPEQAMSGPGYYLPGVPWVMYFYQGYAIHGTYWHNNFGQPMSHGCVNLPSAEAEWFYQFASVGTPVTVVQ